MYTKIIKDQLLKMLNGPKIVPAGLFEISEYFRHNEPIYFDHKKEGDIIIAQSTNFRFGSIITSGKNPKELDKNIKDAILTSFEIPSSYSKETKIINTEEKQNEYALA